MKPIFHKQTIIHIACAITSGILLYFSGFPSPVVLFAFLGPLPLVYILLKEKPLQAFLLSFVTWFIGYFRIFFIYIKMTGALFSLIFVFTIALVFALHSLACVLFRKKLHPLLWTAFYACGFVFIEWIIAMSGMGLHMITAHASVSGIQWLLACSSIGGAYFITFIVRLIPAALGVMIVEKKQFLRVLIPVVVGILFISCTLFGTYYASGPNISEKGRGYKNLVPPALQKKIRAAAIVYEIPEKIIQFYKSNRNIVNKNRQKHEEYLWYMVEKYETLIRRAATDNVSIVAGPECSFFVPDFLLPDFTNRIVQLSRECSTTIIIGFWENLTPANSAIIALPDGKNFKIDKHYLVPFIESNYYSPGSKEPLVINTHKVRLSVKICFELNFPGVFRTMAKKGADLLIAPSLDWWESAELHAYETHYRGVENGIALLRPCRQGLTTIVDPYGNCVAKAIPDNNMVTYLVADLPLKEKSGTFYTYTGDWIAYLSVLLILICCFIPLSSKIIHKKITEEIDKDET